MNKRELKKEIKKWNAILTQHGLPGLEYGERFHHGESGDGWYVPVRKLVDGQEADRMHVSDASSAPLNAPVWVFNDGKLRALLLKTFPKLQTNSKHRQSAARWLFAAVAHWRLGWTIRQVGEQFDLNKSAGNRLLQRVRKAGDALFAEDKDANLIN